MPNSSPPARSSPDLTQAVQQLPGSTRHSSRAIMRRAIDRGELPRTPTSRSRSTLPPARCLCTPSSQGSGFPLSTLNDWRMPCSAPSAAPAAEDAVVGAAVPGAVRMALDGQQPCHEAISGRDGAGQEATRLLLAKRGTRPAGGPRPIPPPRQKEGPATPEDAKPRRDGGIPRRAPGRARRPGRWPVPRLDHG